MYTLENPQFFLGRGQNVEVLHENVIQIFDSSEQLKMALYIHIVAVTAPYYL